MEICDVRTASAGDRPASPVTFPASQAQLRFWFEEQLAPRNPALNITARWQLDGDVAHGLLEDAWRRLVDRHDALRTALRASGDEPLQCVEARVPFTVPLYDLRGMPTGERAAEVERLARKEARTPFDIGHAPLIRVARLILADARSVLLVTAHQIVCDRDSLGVLLRELGATLAHLRCGAGAPAAPTSFGFGTFAADQRGRTTPARLAEERLRVRELLRGFKQFELLTDRPRPRDFTSNGDVVSLVLDRATRDAVAQLAAANECTLFETALAALMTLFYRYTGETDILLCTHVSGRDEPQAQTLVGACANAIALRGDVSGNPAFRTLLHRTHEMHARSLRLRDVPLQQLIEIAGPARDASRNAVFSINVTATPAHASGDLPEGLRLVDLPSTPAGVLYDISIALVDEPHGLRVTCEYNTDLFDAPTIVGLLDALRNVLASVTADPTQEVDRIAVLSAATQRDLVVTLNQTQAPYPHDTTLPQLVAEQARRTPEALAVRCAGTTLTYAQLDAAAGELAGRILRDGREPGMHVGILLERSCEMLVAMLAVMRAGCAYIPLDPAYPAERLAFIAADGALAAIITRSALAERIAAPGIARILVAEHGAGESAGVIRTDSSPAPLRAGSPDDIAYVLYTSGSTGKPKGVQISHAALINLLWAMRERPGMTASDTLVAVTTISFDIAGLELFLPLVSGATVVIAKEAEIVDGQALLALLRRSGATMMQATPVTWQLLIDAGWHGDPALKMLCGGEALPRPLADQLAARGGELWNMYGPTETTIWSAANRVTAGDGPVLIGPPIANTRFYVLDRTGALVPPGVPGELFIGGASLAQGYFGRDDLTRERFLADPFADAPGARMYRTGDVVRMRAGGYEFLGRTDHQIKLRGFRIELDEIVAALLRAPGVAEAAAVTVDRAGRETSIRAYVVAADATAVDAAHWPGLLRARIAEFLPAYMVPAAIMTLERLPRTPNGKLDRAALPDVLFDTPDGADEPPATPTEAAVGVLACELLSRETIGRRSDLFALGFHSLVAVRLIARVLERFDVRLAVRTIFDGPTVAEIARAIDVARVRGGFGRFADPEPIVAYHTDGTEAPFFFFHNDPYADGLYCRRLAQRLGSAQPFYAVAPHGSAGLPLYPSIAAMARDHLARIKALRPVGPYRIGGHCYGGLVAFEVARLLRAQGERVDKLVISNIYAPIRFGLPGVDATLRFIGFNEALDPELREKMCANIARLAHSVVNGPAAILRFIAARCTKARYTAAQYTEGESGETIGTAVFSVPTEPDRRRVLTDMVARTTYHPGPYDGDLSLIWSGDEIVALGDPTKGDPTMGWVKLAADVRVIPMHGGHVDLIRTYVDEYAGLLMRSLARS